MQYLTQDKVKTLLEYDPDTGRFVWLSDRPGGRIKAGDVAGTTHYSGYRYVTVAGTTVTEHRLAWFYTYGRWPTGDLDHINRLRSDNRLCNLRETTRAENCQNQPIRKSNKSGVTGVYYHKVSFKWAATINIGKRQVHLGVYDAMEDAIKARRAAEKEHYPNANAAV